MKRNFSTIVLLLICSVAFSQTVEFIKKPWEEVLAMAKEKNKPIFVDVYTQSCGPCKRMDKEVFTNPGVARLMNDSLIAFKMDAGLKENRWAMDAYSIRSYPTLLYFSSTGELICKYAGAEDVSGVTEITRSVLKQSTDPKPLSVWKKEYESNKGNTAFLLDYIKKLQDLNLNTGKVIDEYLSLIPEKERYSKQNLNLIFNNASSLTLNGIACKVLISSRDTLLTRLSQEDTDETLGVIIGQYAMALLESAAIDTNEVSVEQAISIASNIKSPYLKQPGYDLQMRSYYYGLINDYKRYADITLTYIEKYYLNNSKCLNSDTTLTVLALNKYAGNFFYVVNEPEKLNKALDWCDKCIELTTANAMAKEYFYSTVLDTKANLLYKTGNIAESLKLKEQAILAIPVKDETASDRAKLAGEMERMKKGEKIWEI